MEAKIYNIKGAAVGEVKLSDAVFGMPWRADIVTQVVNAFMQNKRPTVAHTKGRGDVRGGGRKPWQQKGTGRARHGSSRSPIWVGGGVAHGPTKEKKYGQKINRSMKAKALAMALSQKVRDGEALFVDALSFVAPKTKDAKAALLGLSKVKGYEGVTLRKHNAALIAVPVRTSALVKSFKNFGNIAVEEVRNITPLDLLTYRHLLVVDPARSVELLTARCRK